VRSIGLSMLVSLCVAALAHCHSLNKVFASLDEALVTKIAAFYGSLDLFWLRGRRLTDADRGNQTQHQG